MKRVSENRRSGGSRSLFLWTYFSNIYFATGQQKSRSKHFDVCSDMARGDNSNPACLWAFQDNFYRSFSIFV